MRWEIDVAGTADTQCVIDLYEEAMAWLGSQGLDQWQGMPGYAGRIARDVQAGVVRVVRNNVGEIVASVKLDARADPELWWPEDDPADALYAHRMLVARSAAGQHLGSAMLDWASVRAADAGKRWLRLDAWASNDRLHGYYVREGFEMVRLLRFPHRGSGALFQRRAGVETSCGPRLMEGMPLHVRAGTAAAPDGPAGMHEAGSVPVGG